MKYLKILLTLLFIVLSNNVIIGQSLGIKNTTIVSNNTPLPRFVYAADLDGSTEYMSNSTPVNLDLNDINRVVYDVDNDFELAEIITNGTFDSDDDWFKGTGWSIGAGVASCDGSQSSTSIIYQNVAGMVTGKQILITYTVSNYSAGNVRPLSANAGTYVSANGTYIEQLEVLGTSFAMQADVDFIGDIDNIIVTIFPSYTATGNHSFDSTSVDPLTGTYSGVITSVAGSNYVTAFTNHGGVDAYEIYSTSGADINNAVNSTDLGIAYSAVPVVAGYTYRVQYNLTLTSGTAPDFQWGATSSLGSGDIISAGSGSQNVIVVAPAGVSFVGFRVEDGVATDFLTTGFSFTKIAGHADSNYVSLPSDKFTVLEDGSKYTFQMQAKSVGILGSDLTTSLVNGDGGGGTWGYETFTTAGDSASSVINTASYGGAVSNSIGAIVVGEVYRAEFTITLNSGTLPNIRLVEGTTGVSGARSNLEVVTDGFNSILLKVTTASTNGRLQFDVGDGVTTNYILDDVDLFLITPPDLEVVIGSATNEVELLTNGAFEDGTGWVVNEWVIANGKATGTATVSNLQQSSISLTIGVDYLVTYTILDYVGGNVRAELGGDGFAGTTNGANGTFQDIITAGGSSFLFDGRTSFTGSIDNVSVQKIGKTFSDVDPSVTETLVWNFEWDTTGHNVVIDPTFNDSSQWSGTNVIIDGAAIFINNSGQINSIQTIEIGQKYLTSYTIFDYVSGIMRIEVGNNDGAGISRASNGTFVEIITGAGTTNLVWDAQNPFTGKITNVSVTPVIPIQIFSSQPDTIRIDEVDLSEAYDMSIMEWDKTTPISADYIIQHWDGTNGWVLYYNAGVIFSIVDVAENSYQINILTDNDVWEHHSITLDRTGYVRLYDDGVIKDSVDITGMGVISRTNLQFVLGAKYDGSGSYELNGLFGETQIIRGRILTASEILTAFQRGQKGKNFLPTGNEVGWWKFKGDDDAIFLSDETGDNDLSGVNVTRSDDQIKLKKYED